MKLLLIQPSRQYNNGTILKANKGLMPGLSLPQIAALTPEDFEIEIIDEYLEYVDYNAKCDLVGITAYTLEVKRAYRIAEEFRRRGKKVVIGGIHATAMPQEALNYCDAVVVGEAENIWLQLINDFKQNKLMQIYSSSDLPKMESLPTPRYDLIKMHKYMLAGWPVETTRGCPKKCSFCSTARFYGNKYRYRPISDVIRDIKVIMSLGGKYIHFIDNNLTANTEYAKKLFAELVSLKIKWGCSCTIDIGSNKEFLKLAYKSGCRYAFLGVESITEESLGSVKKKFNQVNQYEFLLKNFRKQGIVTELGMIFGFDGDSEQSIDDTFKFLTKNRVPVVSLMILVPYPGTDVANSLKRENRLLSEDWSIYDGTNVVYKPKKIEKGLLNKKYWDVYSKFYSIPGIYKRLFFPYPIPRVFEVLVENYLYRWGVKLKKLCWGYKPRLVLESKLYGSLLNPAEE